MEKIYIASVCKGGILGGALVMTDEKVAFHTGKLTVSPRLRNLELPFCRIQTVGRSRLAFLPTVTFKMKDGEVWQFVVFGRKGFLSNLRMAMDEYNL